MTAALQEFMRGLIDYAGLFPPAQLPLDQAIRKYAEYRRHADAWMLGRFIIQAAKLKELTPFAPELFTQAPPFVFSALGRGGKDSTDFARGLADDLNAIRDFTQTHGKLVAVDAFEVRVPHADVVAPAVESIAAQAPAPITPSFEGALSADWRDAVPKLVRAVAAAKNLARGNCAAPQYKLRCGGVEAAAFPSPEQVAFVIAQCRAANVPLKCTAGLHHPIRHYNDGVKTKMHGFVNVFAAGILAQTNTLNDAELRAIIEDETAENFSFDASGLRWKNLRATPEQIKQARNLVTSYGSCSFDEPRDDLRTLHWM